MYVVFILESYLNKDRNEEVKLLYSADKTREVFENQSDVEGIQSSGDDA
jgi:hypothetical protein